jgi:hypothetical protein
MFTLFPPINTLCNILKANNKSFEGDLRKCRNPRQNCRKWKIDVYTKLEKAKIELR